MIIAFPGSTSLPSQLSSSYSLLPGTLTLSDDLAVTFAIYIHSLICSLPHQQIIIEHLVYAMDWNRIHGTMVNTNVHLPS